MIDALEHVLLVSEAVTRALELFDLTVDAFDRTVLVRRLGGVDHPGKILTERCHCRVECGSIALVCGDDGRQFSVVPTHQGIMNRQVGGVGGLERCGNASAQVNGVLLGRVLVKAEQVVRLLGVWLSFMKQLPKRADLTMKVSL